ncbi:hypothetical protein [uncultured Alistipes sp.]|uniref:hypothetical protein n=1 Tax=uncultured Alistipes sp. TaxID=538949 RepID=UPI00262F2B24|nr:hypothetical protein [uncultured Alistipes sp.]
MDTKQAAPGTRSEYAGASIIAAKDTKLCGFHQRRVINLLSDGKHYSVADISVALHLSDPRSVIRNLREKGHPISDEWCDAVHGGGRFKRYFIHGENGHE